MTRLVEGIVAAQTADLKALNAIILTTVLR